MVSLYLPFLSLLDGKPIMRVKRLSRQKSEDVQKLFVDTRKPLIELTLNANIEGQTVDLSKASARRQRLTGALSSLSNPYNSVMNFKRSVIDLKKSTANLRRGIKETPLKELKKAYLRQDRKRRPPMLRESESFVGKDVKSHFTARAAQNETLESNEVEIERVLCEKKQAALNNEMNRSQTIAYNAAQKQAKENYISKIEKLEKDSEVLKANNKELEQLIIKLKKTYSTILKKELNNIVAYIIREMGSKISRSFKNYENSMQQLIECNKMLQKAFRQTLSSNRIMKCAIDRLRSEKEKTEESCAELQEENSLLEAELNRCREELDHDSKFREELKEYKALAYQAVNATKNDEYYAMEAELGKSKAANVELQVQLAKEQKEYITERNKLLTTTFELKKDIKSLSEAHEENIQRIIKENQEEIANKDKELASLIADRDRILGELNQIKAGRIKGDEGTMVGSF